MQEFHPPHPSVCVSVAQKAREQFEEAEKSLKDTEESIRYGFGLQPATFGEGKGLEWPASGHHPSVGPLV